MDFSEFKKKYSKVPVVEHPNNREGKVPLVTVKVVTYNHVNYIKQCLDSILIQKTNFDYEILIAEDDSNDGTREICIKYAKKHPDKIRLLLNSRENNIIINGKPSGTFNSVYANFCIHSKYIAFIEGDDYWTDETSLQKRVDFLENNPDHVLCFHNAKLFYEDTKEFDKKLKSSFDKSQTLEKNSFKNVTSATLTYVYRNFLVDIFDKEMLNIISGDTILIAKLENFGKIRYIHEIKPGVYRIHNKGIHSSLNYNSQKLARITALIYIYEYYQKKGWHIDLLHENLFNLYINKIVNHAQILKKFRIKDLIKVCKHFYACNQKFYAVKIFTKNLRISLKQNK
ncbi:glycosyltransferase [Polaribacter sp. WD7]|uniref:glycosyltransferase family 2 protein n=1 Tax=Polaribacter sp. WD7 TaxID=2269061 RepID=UPI000DF407CD|nr:glycosyltransferase [Polaribacter sp. WD7]RCS26015.1 glycosyltransferase [Polaribacter sp. WD7]